MKKTHIIAIVLIAVSIGVILSTIKDSSSFVSFSEAVENPGVSYQVIGELNKEKELEYDPHENANLFSFYMLDAEGNEQKVYFHGTKPQDFERSEQVVVHGKFENNEFHASKILMKCPSKYNNGSTELQEFNAEEVS